MHTVHLWVGNKHLLVYHLLPWLFLVRLDKQPHQKGYTCKLSHNIHCESRYGELRCLEQTLTGTSSSAFIDTLHTPKGEKCMIE